MLLGAGQGEHRELGLNGPDLCIGSQWLLSLFKSRGLRGIKCSYLVTRGWLSMFSPRGLFCSC
jgi:hypothetical protein